MQSTNVPVRHGVKVPANAGVDQALQPERPPAQGDTELASKI